MRQTRKEAFGFRAGQRVRMLVETMGADANDEERTYPVGTEAVIDTIEYLNEKQGVSFALVIGPTDGDEAIVNCFDQEDGHPSKLFQSLEETHAA